MKNVTYLIGAGASANALPIVNQLPHKLDEFIGWLKGDFRYALSEQDFYEDIEFSTPKTKFEIQQEFFDGLEWLLGECRNHSSIDTFAKKLWLGKKYEALAKLKCLFSIYFICEQNQRSADLRYDSFFASILDALYYLPNHINILSWNYDYQFEKAFSGFTDRTNIYDIRSQLQVDYKGFLNNWPPKERLFSILKLNGSTLPYSFQNKYEALNLMEPFSVSFLDKIIYTYASLLAFIEKGNNLEDAVYKYPLSFAWEERNIKDSWGNPIQVTDAAKISVRDTEVLIVIGYSFPFFNRDIDRKIIRSMSKLEKVYFQAPNADEIKETFSSVSDLSSDKLFSIKNTNQFYLPSEL